MKEQDAKADRIPGRSRGDTAVTPLEGVVNRQLVRYGLTPPSSKAHSLTSIYDSGLDDFGYSALCGKVWLAGSGHQLCPFDEPSHVHALSGQGAPTLGNLWGWDEHPLTISISAQADWPQFSH